MRLSFGATGPNLMKHRKRNWSSRGNIAWFLGAFSVFCPEFIFRISFTSGNIAKHYVKRPWPNNVKKKSRQASISPGNPGGAQVETHLWDAVADPYRWLDERGPIPRYWQMGQANRAASRAGPLPGPTPAR